MTAMARAISRTLLPISGEAVGGKETAGIFPSTNRAYARRTDTLMLR